MNISIKNPTDLIFEEYRWWADHADELADLALIAAESGSLEEAKRLVNAGNLAIRRAQQARAEWRRVSGL